MAPVSEGSWGTRVHRLFHFCSPGILCNLFKIYWLLLLNVLRDGYAPKPHSCCRRVPHKSRVGASLPYWKWQAEWENYLKSHNQPARFLNSNSKPMGFSLDLQSKNRFFSLLQSLIFKDFPVSMCLAHVQVTCKEQEIIRKPWDALL